MENILEFPDKALIADEACEWVVKIARDEPLSKEDAAALNAWVAQSASHKAVLQEMASTWQGLDLLGELQVPGQSVPVVRRKILGVFIWWLLAPIWLLANSVQAVGRVLHALFSPSSSVQYALSAAVLVVSLGVGSLWFQEQGGPEYYVTVLGEQSTHLLQDGSSLRLNTNSQVAVQYTAEQRTIRLIQGEAHFDVKPDASRPFEVYAGNRMVRAVGTSFSVYLSGENVKVMVTEGKVDLAVVTYAQLDASMTDASVTDASSNAERVGSLEAGQGIVVPADMNAVISSVVNYQQDELLRRLAWIDGRLVFKGDALEEVVKEVSRYTPMHIEVVDDGIKKIRIGGSFQVGQTEKLFDALRLGFNIKVVRISAHHVQLFAQE